MRRSLTGCIDDVLKSQLSSEAWDIYIHNDFWGWIDKETGLYSIAIGYNNRDWLCKDVTIEKLEQLLIFENPFLREVRMLSGVM